MGSEYWIEGYEMKYIHVLGLLSVNTIWEIGKCFEAKKAIKIISFLLFLHLILLDWTLEIEINPFFFSFFFQVTTWSFVYSMKTTLYLCICYELRVSTGNRCKFVFCFWKLSSFLNDEKLKYLNNKFTILTFKQGL